MSDHKTNGSFIAKISDSICIFCWKWWCDLDMWICLSFESLNFPCCVRHWAFAVAWVETFFDVFSVWPRLFGWASPTGMSVDHDLRGCRLTDCATQNFHWIDSELDVHVIIASGGEIYRRRWWGRCDRSCVSLLFSLMRAKVNSLELGSRFERIVTFYPKTETTHLFSDTWVKGLNNYFYDVYLFSFSKKSRWFCVLASLVFECCVALNPCSL